MPYTPEFTLQGGLHRDFPNNFRLYADYQHFQDMHAGTLFRTSPSGSPASNFPSLTDLNLLPDANTVDLRLDYSLRFQPLSLENVRLFLAVGNVLNFRHACALQTNSARQKGY